MRFHLRKSLLLVLILAVVTPGLRADHLVADCPLSLVGTTAPSRPFTNSPHGIFRNGSVIYALRGDRLTTLSINPVGEIVVAREDALAPLTSREDEGGVAYSNGFLYVSSEIGLQIFDLRNVQPGISGEPPILVSTTRGLHYRRLAVMGNLLAGLYPATDLPCIPNGDGCRNSIDIFNVSNPVSPSLMSRIPSINNFVGFNDIKFANGYLYTTGFGGTFGFDLTNPAAPTTVYSDIVTGTFLTTNGTDLIAVGQETLIGVFTIGPGALLNYFNVFTLPSLFDRANQIMFHPEATFDEGHLITMIDEKNPFNGKPGRTIAFDTFDFSVPFFEGFDDRIYENVSFTNPDELKFDPIAVGPFVYVNGEISGLQVWGACGQLAGGIEFDNPRNLACGGAEISGFITGAQRIVSVELFLGSTPLGMATLGRPRNDIHSSNQVIGFGLRVNLDQVPAGNQTIRAIGTDSVGNRRQFASRVINFGGPGQNCTQRRRSAKR